MRLRLRAAAAVMLAGLALVGCDQKGNEAKHIKVGVINGAEQDVAEVAKKVAKEKYGLEVELVGFSGSLLPNESTNAGDLDANVFQHRPFLEQDNKAHNYHLVAVGNTFVFPMAGYSRKIKSVAELKDGATIAIPNDPTNLGRALLLLQKEKLITLKAGTGLLPTAVDITDNPRNLKIMELEGAQLPRVLDDPKVDVAIISTTYLQQTGLSPVRDGIFIEDKNSPYVNIIVTREDNKDAQNVKEFMQSYQSPEVAKAAETIFNGGAVPGLVSQHTGEARMVRQRQADLLLIAATVIAACGWIFSREAIAGMPVFAFLGLRFSSPRCFCCRSAAVFARKSSTGQNSSSADSGLRSTSACGSIRSPRRRRSAKGRLS